MTKGRDLAAESISDLLDVARAHKRSGMLRAEYSQGGRLEEGEIYVFVGQPIYARTGRLTGPEALRRLLSWRHIYFSFVPDAPRPRANLTSTLPLHLGNGSTPSSAPLNTPTGPVMRSPTTGDLRWQQPMENRNDVPPPQNRIPGIEQRVPQKVGPERDAQSLPLSRRQRFVYFMVDGRRTAGELAHFTNKTILEVEVILGELQDLGLIVI